MKNSLTANSVYKRQVEYSKKAFENDNLMPRRYVFVLTNLCNLKCTFCFQERKKRADRMTTEDWLKVVNQIPKNSRITLTGGEPLVYKDFDMVFAKANEFNETNIVTNGLLLNDQKVENLIEEINFKILGVSVDTIGNTNRDFTKLQWETLVSQLNRFVTLRDKKNHESALDIKTVILDENIDDLFEIHKFTMEIFKADTHSLQMLKGASIQHSDLMFDFQKIDDDYKAYQYKKYDNFINQLNLIKEYDYKYGYKSYLHPNLVNLNDEKKLKKEDLVYLNNKKHEKNNFIDQVVSFCSRCQHLYLENQIKSKFLYNDKDYIFTSTKSYSAIYSNNKFYDFIISNLGIKKIESILEIGCNDLYLLKKFYRKSKKLFGIDPVIKKNSKFKRIVVIKEFFNKQSKQKIPEKNDVIICGHTLEHIEEPELFIKNVLSCADQNSKIFLQFPSAESLILSGSFQQVQHQHLNYFSIKSFGKILGKCGGKIIDYQYNNLHYGTIMIYFTLKESKQKQIKKLKKIKNITQNNLINSYVNFKLNLSSKKKIINSYLNKNKKFYVVGAAPMLPLVNYHMDNIVNKAHAILDDDRNKIDKYFPGIKPKIKSLKKTDLKNSLCMVGPVASAITTRKIVAILAEKKAEFILTPTLTF